MRLRLQACCSVLLSVFWLGSALAPAQETQGPPPQPSSPPMVSGYPVVGRVVCADTQRAARFAQVMLVPASSGVSDYDRGRTAIGRTDLDGRFAIDNVPPGDYYVTGEMTGYINEASAVRIALSQGGDALNAIAAVPRIGVGAGGATVQLSLQRGGIVAGTVQWDDGSPAAGVQVNVQPASGTGIDSSIQSGGGRPGGLAGVGTGGQTDGRGRFRRSGGPAGRDVLRASVQSPMPQGPGTEGGRFQRLMSLNVYAPNKLRKTEATVINLGAGEERADVNVVLGLTGMHTVSGQVSSSSAAVRSGSVQLTDQTDSTLNRRGTIAADGSFLVPYVPPGTYTLRVTASAQAANNGRGGGPNASDNATRFQPMQESVTVTDSDLTGVSVTVNPATSSP